ncbi:hypothetical protein Tco_1358787 [Tanacetum coccineum]
MVSSLNNSEINFRITFDESDDEDYTLIFDKNLFSYKIISANDLKTNSENDNEKVNMPLFPSSEPSVSCINDLDFFKDFENEFPAIVYNDALTSKSDFSTEPTLCPQHIDKFDFKDETSLSEYDEVEQNVLYFNDLFPFNIIYLDGLKLNKDNDNEINMIQSSRGNENTQGSTKLLEASHDKINKVFKMKSFIMELNVNIVAWNYFVNGMLFNLIKNLYVPFGIPFDLKRYYKDGDYTRMLRRPRISSTGDFLGITSSYTSIRDPLLRLCHRLIACSIGGRSQLPKKVFEIVCFEEEAGGHDIWRKISSGLERYLDATASAPGAFEDAPIADEGALAVPTPVQAPQPPPPIAGPARTIAQRLARVEEDVHEIHGALGKKREILDSMAYDFS